MGISWRNIAPGLVAIVLRACRARNGASIRSNVAELAENNCSLSGADKLL